MLRGMDREQSRERASAWTWKEELGRRAASFEDWIDRMALRLGDAIFARETVEKIFGPHPLQR